MITFEKDEPIAYSSLDWDGILEDGHIVETGTRGWCISHLGDSIVHAGSGIDIWTVPFDPEKPIRLSYVDSYLTNN